MTERPHSLSEITARKKPNTVTVPVCLDPELEDELDRAVAVVEANQGLVRTKKQPSAQDRRALADAEAALEEARTKAEAETVRFKLRAIGRLAFETLVSAHPPTGKQLTEARKKIGEWESVPHDDDEVPPSLPDWDVETFPAALVAASLVDPEATVEEVQALFDSDAWSGAETATLFTAALFVNQRMRGGSLGNV